MKAIKKLYVKYGEAIKYLFFGVLTTALSIVSFALFQALLGKENYLISNVISWIIAVIFAFFTNKLWVFSSKTWKLSVVIKEALLFFAARVTSLIIEEGGLLLLIDVLRFGSISFKVMGYGITGDLIAKFIMQVIVIIVNYIFSKLFIFKKEKTR